MRTIVFILCLISGFLFGFSMTCLSENKNKTASRYMLSSYICVMIVIIIMLQKLGLW